MGFICLCFAAVVAFVHFQPACSLRISGSRLLRRRTSALSADLQLRIQGTKNAYTTVLPGDVVSFQLEDTTLDGKTKGLGAFSADGVILPLCSVDGERFTVDSRQSPISAEKLRSEGRLLRVYSSEKRADQFTISEYVDDDIVTDPLPDTATEQSAEHPPLQHAVRSVICARASSPLGPSSQAVAVVGLLFLSSSLGIDPSTGLLADGITKQTECALSNMFAILRSAGGELDALAKVTVMLTDLSNLEAVNGIYAQAFKDAGVGGYPARTVFQVAGLPMGALVGMDGVAAGIPT